MSPEAAQAGAKLKDATQLSREYLLGLLRAALRPSRIDPDEVRKVLRLIKAAGKDPVGLYREAMRSRPEAFDAPPLLASLLGKDVPKDKQLDLQVGETLSKRSRRG